MTHAPEQSGLDLAPKLKRPLSLWNPLDYLRLLYWVFYFPQAIRWYVEEFGEDLRLEGSWRSILRADWLRLWREAPVLRSLILQASILVLTVTFATTWTLHHYLGAPLDWGGVVVGMAIGMVVGARKDAKGSVVVGGVAGGVIGGIAGGIGIEVRVIEGVRVKGDVLIWGTIWSATLGVVRGVTGGIRSDAARDVAMSMVFSLTLSLIFSVIIIWDVVQGMVWGVPAAVLTLMQWPVVWGVGISRLDAWLLGTLDLFVVKCIFLRRRSYHSTIARNTFIPNPRMTMLLIQELEKGWTSGVHAINQTLAFSLQFIPALKALHTVLEKTPPKDLLSRLAVLAEAPYDWDVVRFTSASLTAAMKRRAVDGIFFFVPSRWRAALKARRDDAPRLDVPYRAAAAGFWYLHAGEAEEAAQAFRRVRRLPHGEEMFLLAWTLALAERAKRLEQIATLRIPTPPSDDLLRPRTWEAFARFRRAVEDARVVVHSASRAARAFALNRALGEVRAVLEQADALPAAERDLVVEIAWVWQDAFLGAAAEVGEIQITKPVRNPYVIGDPVFGKLFVGREDIMRRLGEQWILSQHLQTVVLYGHRRMGKTSILRNVQGRLGAEVRVAYLNLQGVGDAPHGLSDVLLAMADAIHEATDIPRPDDAAFDPHPYHAFRRYLREVEDVLGDKGLIIALDEFEHLEKLIAQERLPADFLTVMRDYVQMSPKIAFAFAGLHTLEEMTADYFHPFFAGLIPIRVSFLSSGATRQLLANPGEDFPLDYTPEALDAVYALTHGQPYLVQLIGFSLVRRYNDLVFEWGRKRDAVFTPEDVHAVVDRAEFYSQGRYYFTGVWEQAGRGAPGQQVILKALAPHLEGLPPDAIARATGLEEQALAAALDTLCRHDVVAEVDGRWRILVELFRRWMLREFELEEVAWPVDVK